VKVSHLPSRTMMNICDDCLQHTLTPHSPTQPSHSHHTHLLSPHTHSHCSHYTHTYLATNSHTHTPHTLTHAQTTSPRRVSPPYLQDGILPTHHKASDTIWTTSHRQLTGGCPMMQRTHWDYLQAGRWLDHHVMVHTMSSEFLVHTHQKPSVVIHTHQY